MDHAAAARTAIVDFGQLKGLENLGFINGRTLVRSHGLEVAFIHPDAGSDILLVAARVIPIDGEETTLNVLLSQASRLWLREGVTLSITDDNMLQVSSPVAIDALIGNALAQEFDRLVDVANALAKSLEEPNTSTIEGTRSGASNASGLPTGIPV